MTTPSYTDGFIENLNLVARHIREVDTSIFADVNVYIELSRRWAMENYEVEVDPINHPGKFSSYSYSLESALSADEAEALANSILELTVSATTIPFATPATAVYDPVTGHMDLGIPAGDNGEKWHIVNTTPSLALGDWGDLALNSLNSDVYEKQEVANAWILVANIRGIQGEQGIPGMGVYPQGLATVAQLNALTADPGAGDLWIMIDGGTVTYGSQPVDVVPNDWLGWGAEGYFVNMGQIQGPPGEDGSVWTSSNFDPAQPDGNPGDYHMNNSTSDYFRKGLVLWTLEGNLKGEQGDKGDVGDDGVPGEVWHLAPNDPDPATGIDGDLGLNTLTNFYFEKTAGIWVYVGTLEGEKGDQGDQGEAGTGLYMQGDYTVDQVNAILEITMQTGFAYYMLDAGIITLGAVDVPVIPEDIITWSEENSFINMGPIQGPAGPQGDDGATWTTSLFDPVNTEGEDDDLHLNDSSGDYFKKIVGVWKLQGNLIGPVGPEGSTAWNEITGVPEHVANAVSRLGDTMSGTLVIKEDGGSKLILQQENAGESLEVLFNNETNETRGRVFLNEASGEMIIETINDLDITTTSVRLGSNGTLYVNGNKVWHAGNDGEGSGLDADTLDTHVADEFLLAGGDNIEGPMNMTAAGSASGNWKFTGSRAPTTPVVATLPNDITNLATVNAIFDALRPPAPTIVPPSFMDVEIGDLRTYEITDYDNSMTYNVTSDDPILSTVREVFIDPDYFGYIDVVPLYPHYTEARVQITIAVTATASGSLPSSPALPTMVIIVPEEEFFVYNNDDFVFNAEFAYGWGIVGTFDNHDFPAYGKEVYGFSYEYVYTNIDFDLNQEYSHGFIFA